MLAHVPLLEVTAHRVLWTLLAILPVVALRHSWKTTWNACRTPRVILVHGVAAIFLSGNWLIYVWATVNDHIIEGALGYYINPFLYILLGSIFLGEKHSRLQLIAIIVAAAGVILQFQAIQGVPWAALGLAFTFAAYGMIRKLSPLGPFSGLTLETSLLLPLIATYLIHEQFQGKSTFGSDHTSTLLLIGAGLVTAVPLLCFARGARSISLSLLGILQFIGPTGQFLIGWLVYNEPLPPLRLASFFLIWLAVSLYIFSLYSSQQTSSQKNTG